MFPSPVSWAHVLRSQHYPAKSTGSSQLLRRTFNQLFVRLQASLTRILIHNGPPRFTVAPLGLPPVTPQDTPSRAVT
jgi:hypothetical protein